MKEIATQLPMLLVLTLFYFYSASWADPEGLGQGCPDPHEKSQNIGFLSNTGPDPLKYHKATKQAFNIGPSSGTLVKTPFRWRARDGPLIVVIGSSFHASIKKQNKTKKTTLS